MLHPPPLDPHNRISFRRFSFENKILLTYSRGISQVLAAQRQNLRRNKSAESPSYELKNRSKVIIWMKTKGEGVNNDNYVTVVLMSDNQ